MNYTECLIHVLLYDMSQDQVYALARRAQEVYAEQERHIAPLLLRDARRGVGQPKTRKD